MYKAAFGQKNPKFWELRNCLRAVFSAVDQLHGNGLFPLLRTMSCFFGEECPDSENFRENRCGSRTSAGILEANAR